MCGFVSQSKTVCLDFHSEQAIGVDGENGVGEALFSLSVSIRLSVAEHVDGTCSD